MTLTLSIDCGGGGIKVAVLDARGRQTAESVRVPTPYPLSTSRLRDLLVETAGEFPQADRATVGLPGMVRHGVVISTPHYVTTAGPSTAVAEHLVDEWWGFDAQRAVSAWLGLPTLVLNDAELHAAGAVVGDGVELVLTLGTGLGCAWTDNGTLAPHLELSAAKVVRDVTADDFVGELARREVGDQQWCERVEHLVGWLAPVFAWDRLYLGGGNAQRLPPERVAGWGDGVSLIANDAALVGGVRAWDLGFGSRTPI